MPRRGTWVCPVGSGSHLRASSRVVTQPSLQPEALAQVAGRPSVACLWPRTQGLAPRGHGLASACPGLGVGTGEPAGCLQMIKKLAAAPWSREAPASRAQSSLFPFWHQAGLLMFISPCLLFLTLLRMFLQAGRVRQASGESVGPGPWPRCHPGRVSARPAQPPH